MLAELLAIPIMNLMEIKISIEFHLDMDHVEDACWCECGST